MDDKDLLIAHLEAALLLALQIDAGIVSHLIKMALVDLALAEVENKPNAAVI